jgi:phosphoenolpyruvate---glycerone phosphotransferase subunit DhaK
VTATSGGRASHSGLKKLINDPFDVVDEMLEGFVAAHADIVRLVGERAVARIPPDHPKVGLVIGGGSGHEPAFVGYVGAGLADAAAVGNIFAAPSPDTCLAAIRAVSTGMGVLLAYGNYAGDIMNFGIAAERAAADGIEVRTVLVTDDVASAPNTEIDRRRGIAGDVIVFKCAGAMAERGASLDEVERIARATNAATRTMGVALYPCEVPGAGRLSFELADDEIEIGLGLHGEPGMRRGMLLSADETAEALMETILADVPEPSGHEVALLVNGLGATAQIELYIVYRAARRALERAGCTVTRSMVGDFITSLEMAGASVTVTLLDEELRGLLDDPARAARFVR